MGFNIRQLLLKLDLRVRDRRFFVLKLGDQLILILEFGLEGVVHGDHVFLLVLELLPLLLVVGLEVSLLLGESLL